MNKETLSQLEENEDSRVRSIEKLALILDVSFEEAARIRESDEIRK